MENIDKYSVERLVLGMTVRHIQDEYVQYIQHGNSLLEDSDFAICGDTLAIARASYCVTI